MEGCAKGNDEINFKTSDGKSYRFYHSQDCCENVSIEDVIGNPEDLIGSPLLMAEEVSGDNEPAPEYAESYTWTFYKFATINGYVTVRWLGQSNGYYSEDVNLEEVK